jgi:hypothetical protein
MMQVRIVFCLLILMFYTGYSSVFAQETDTTKGGTEIIQDDRVGLLVQKHIQINQALNSMPGFRIQVFSESGINSKTKAQDVYDEFQSRFPEKEVYLTFKSPNYRVRIGNFRTKLDAQRFLIELTADYPNAFIIADEINLPQTEY